jgi:hypothetical protein
MRRWVPVLVLLAAAVFPASALADPPTNDAQAAPATLPTTYTSQAPLTISVPIPPGPTGGWLDATTAPDDPSPTCVGAQGFHSMWYTVSVAEASVLTVTLTSGDVSRYQPMVSIIGPISATQTAIELGCGLGGNDSRADPSAIASGYVSNGTYLVRIASVMLGSGSLTDSPTLTLKAVLRDVTPPSITVAIPQKVLGVGETYRFDATGSGDSGSGVDQSSAAWQFRESGSEGHPSKHSSNPLIGLYAWRKAGLHRVTVSLADKTNNRSTYTFFVLVHSFAVPKVGLRVFVPSPGARQIRLEISHDMPVTVRLVVLQRGRKLAVVPAKRLTGKTKSTVRLALRGRVSRNGFVVVSGVASDNSVPPNTVPFPMCAVDPVHGGGVCA